MSAYPGDSEHLETRLYYVSGLRARYVYRPDKCPQKGERQTLESLITTTILSTNGKSGPIDGLFVRSPWRLMKHRKPLGTFAQRHTAAAPSIALESLFGGPKPFGSITQASTVSEGNNNLFSRLSAAAPNPDPDPSGYIYNIGSEVILLHRSVYIL